MANLFSVRLSKGDSSSWGFRLQGGKDFGTPLIIQKINGGSVAEKAGLKAGDAVVRINTTDVFNLRHKDAQDVILRAGPSFEITVQRGGLTWAPAVSPVGSVTSPRPTQPVNNISPVTATSLSAKRQEHTGAIGTGHNLSAKPYSAVNGGPTLVNKQYNSPVGLYSDESIAETISAQSEVLSNGVVGVNFKKNEKSYDSSHSAVFRMVQEADKEPKDHYEPVKRSDFYATHSHAIGSHRQSDQSQVIKLTEEESKTTTENQQVTTCTDCERVIVGIFVRIKDKNLHVECFKCATCGSSLKNVGYYNINNKLYCDVHAKLAVKNNPPAPNLVPVTVQPGAKIPSGTISAALASHPLPSPGALSPNPSYSPVYQPIGRPYSGVTAPISPTNSLPKFSSSPVSQPEPHSVHTAIWPPPSKEPELPTASPLYFPPPSQVHIPQKPQKTEEVEYSDSDEMSYKTSMGLLNITSAQDLIESSETVSDSIETQMLVDTVRQTNQTIRHLNSSKPPPLETVIPHPGDVAVSFTITEEELKKGICGKHCKHDENTVCTRQDDNQLCSNLMQYNLKKHSEATLRHETYSQKQDEYEKRTCLKQGQAQSIASIYEKAIKVENTHPHKWESPMVVALTTAPETSYSQIPSEPDLCLPLPPKRSTSALTAALTVAPAEPFTPAPHPSIDPVPLPEYTEPYFPPEHPIIIEPPKPKEEDVVEMTPQEPKKPITKKLALNKYTKKDTKNTEDILKELPKPTEKMTMRSALETAPDRPYSPFSPHETKLVQPMPLPEIKNVTEEQLNVQQQPEPAIPKQKVFPKPEPRAEVFTAPERLYSPFTANRIEYDTELLAVEKSSRNITTEEHSMEKHQTKNIETTENVTNISTGCPPIIHCIRSSFETKTDKVQMELSCAFPTNEPITTKRTIEKKTDVTEEQSVCNKQALQETHEERQLVSNINTLGNVSDVAEKHEAKESIRPTRVAAINDQKQIQVFSRNQEKQEEVTENTLIQQACSRIQNKNENLLRERVTVIQPNQSNLTVPQIAFQPVKEDFAVSAAVSSPKPRSVTPCITNGPAPTLPYYQANLVATPQPAAAASIYDPKSPAVSRSPSPYPGARPTSPFPTSTGRAVSPAPGPPPNPLKSNIPVSKIIHDSKMDQARSYVQTYIPQHKTTNIKDESLVKTFACQKHVADDVHTVQNISSSNQQGMVVGTSMHKAQSDIKCQKQELSEKANVAKNTFEVSGNNTIQIQRKKVITEEYEHSRNLTQLEKRTNTTQVSVTEKSDKIGGLGLHLTNPQPLISPFTEKKQPIQTDTPPKPVVTSTTPKLTKLAPLPPKTSSDVNAKPNVSQPNAGTGGGRQSGAVGAAPKRGRGVLNLTASPGSRVPLCGHCHANIRGPFITALGKIWCPEHFSCATPSCRRPLQDLGFVEEQGQLYCEFCFEKYLAPNCAKCSAKVKGDCLKAIGKTFHPECFNCAYCGTLFGNSPFFLEDGQPYCENDWNELFTTKCFACGFPVEAGDRWVEALNNNYHSQCFNCTMCKKNLEGQSFFAKGGRPFCKNHAR